jgi:hypothetical protein
VSSSEREVNGGDSGLCINNLYEWELGTGKAASTTMVWSVDREIR